jgi:hypothetical protein
LLVLSTGTGLLVLSTGTGSVVPPPAVVSTRVGSAVSWRNLSILLILASDYDESNKEAAINADAIIVE